MRASLSVCFLFGLCFIAQAAIVPAKPFFTNNAVLQQKKPISVWGTAAPDESVTVSLGSQQKGTRADSNGKFKLMLNQMNAGGPYTLTFTGSNTVTVQNVMIGDVWFCSGQSNMAHTMSGYTKEYSPTTEISAANFPNIRNMTSKWEVCSPSTAGDFSIVAYFFAKHYHLAKQIPVGIITRAYGGTSVQEFFGGPDIFAEPGVFPIAKAWAAKDTSAYGKAMSAYLDTWMSWYKAKLDSIAAGKTYPPEPVEPVASGKPLYGERYKGIIPNIFPMTIQGILWWQGENDLNLADEYATTFPALITSWRRGFGSQDLPFIFVQVPTGDGMKKGDIVQALPTKVYDPTTNKLRYVFANTSVKVPRTVLVNSFDLPRGTHPPNKELYGGRLSLAAQQMVYDSTIMHSGPVAISAELVGNKIRIKYKHAGKGLTAEGGKLQGFAIAGSNGTFVWAQADIEDSSGSILVYNSTISAPREVIYAWAGAPKFANLFNKNGYPAAVARFTFQTTSVPQRVKPQSSITNFQKTSATFDLRGVKITNNKDSGHKVKILQIGRQAKKQLRLD